MKNEIGIKRRPTRFYSTRQEKEVAKKLGGKRTPNSGATAFFKGDVVSKNWLVECKTSMTDKRQFTIKHEWLSKLIEESFAARREPTLCFDFGPNEKTRYYIITEKQFQLFNDLLFKQEAEENDWK